MTRSKKTQPRRVSRPDFSEASRQPAYQQAVRELSTRLAVTPEPLTARAGGAELMSLLKSGQLPPSSGRIEIHGCFSLPVSNAVAEPALESVHKEFLSRECSVIRHDRGYT